MKIEKITALVDLHHTLQYANTMAIIKKMTPILKRNLLKSVNLEVSDHSQFHNFEVRLELPAESLSGFLDVSKEECIIMLEEFKIVKNDGIVYGVVEDESELALYDESGNWLRWYLEEEKPKLSENASRVLKNLVKLKSGRFKTTNSNKDSTTLTRRSASDKSSNENSTPAKSVTNKIVQNKQNVSNPRNFQNKELSSNKSSPNRKEKLSVSDINLSLESTVRHQSRLSRSGSSLAKSTENMKSSETKLSRSGNRSSPAKSTENMKSSETKLSRSGSRSSPAKSTENMKSSETKLSRSGSRSSPAKSTENMKSSETKLSRSGSRSSPAKSNENMKSSETKLSRSGSRSSLAKSTENMSSEIPLDEVKSDNKINLTVNKHLSTSLPNINKESEKSPTDSKLIPSKSKENSLSNSTIDISRTVRNSLRKRSLIKNLTSPGNNSKPMNGLEKSGSLKKLSWSSNESNELVGNKFLNSSDSSLSSRSRSPSVISSPIIQTKNSNESNLKKSLQSPGSPASSEKNNVLVALRSKPAKDSPSVSPEKRKLRVSNTISPITHDNSSSGSNKKIKPIEKQLSPASRKSSIPSHVIIHKSHKVENEILTKSPKPSLTNETKLKTSKRKTDCQVSEPGSKSPKRGKSTNDTPPEKQSKPSPKRATLSPSLSLIKSTSPSTSGRKTDKNNQLLQKESESLSKKPRAIKTESKISQKVLQSSSLLSTFEIKPTRRSLKTNNEKSSLGGKKSVDVNRHNLREFTKEINLKRLSELPETTLDDIEEISVPERISLECKIVSKFSLIENDIEVIRVVDGTLCEKPMLIVPESPTWPDLVKTVIDDTKVEKNLPFVDIIVLNASRLDNPMIVNKYYKFKNLNLVQFLLRFGSRPVGKVHANEMFCFGEGQNMYPQSGSKASRQEIEKKLQSKKFQDAWETCKGWLVGPAKDILNDLSVSSPTTNTSTEQNEKKRKLSNGQIESPDLSKKPKTTAKKSKLEEKSDCKIQNGMNDGNKSLPRTNHSFLSDETMVGNTPPLVKEYREIMGEMNDEETLSESANEFHHLKASGSELTFSQFCRGVDPVKSHAKTSTQATEPHEKLSQDKSESSDDISRMDPLVYSPSSSSKCSPVPTPSKKISKTCPESTKNATTSCKQTKSSVKADNNIHTSNKQESKNKSDEVIVPTSSSPSIISDDIQMVKHLHGYTKTQSIKKAGDKSKQTSETEDCYILSDKDSSIELVLSGDAVSIGNTIETQQSSVEEINYILVKKENSSTKTKISTEEFFKHLSKNCFLNTTPLAELMADWNAPIENNKLGNQPMLSFNDTIELKKKNYVTVSVKVASIKPASLQRWKEDAVKGRCPDCKQLYSVVESNTTQSQTALSIGSQLLCPNSECSHQLLENPEFHFTLELILKDNSEVSAYIGQHHAETLFDCTAQEALNSVQKSSTVLDTLKKINSLIRNEQFVKMDLTREDITDPKSGPLFVHKIHF